MEVTPSVNKVLEDIDKINGLIEVNKQVTDSKIKLLQEGQKNTNEKLDKEIDYLEQSYFKLSSASAQNKLDFEKRMEVCKVLIGILLILNAILNASEIGIIIYILNLLM